MRASFRFFLVFFAPGQQMCQVFTNHEIFVLCIFICRTEGKPSSLVIQVTSVSFCSPEFGASLFMCSLYGDFDANLASLKSVHKYDVVLEEREIT